MKREIYYLVLVALLSLFLQISHQSSQKGNNVISADYRAENHWYSSREDPFVVSESPIAIPVRYSSQRPDAFSMRVTPTTTEPWSGIVSLDVEFGNDHLSCTGFFIGPRLIATAGECVHNGSGWATDVKVYPGRDSAREPFKFQYGSTFHAMIKWIDEQDEDLNIGIVELPDETLFQATGGVLFKHGSFTDQSLITGLGPNIVGNLAGYPTNEPIPYTDCPGETDGFAGCQLWFDSQLIPSATYSVSQICNPQCTTIQKGLVGYQMEATEEGQSGAPVWLFDGAQRVVVGIHTSNANTTICSTPFNNLNCGPLITPMVAQSFVDIGAAPTALFVATPFHTETYEPPAILLVHGWLGTCGLHFRDFSDQLAQMMVDKRIVSEVAYAEPYIRCFKTNIFGGYPFNNGIVDNARSLSSFAEAWRVGLDPRHEINIVGYSYGSLVSRYYLEQLNGDDTTRTLLMLGPPNNGVDLTEHITRLCAQMPQRLQGICRSSLQAFLPEDSALADMQPKSVDSLLNANYTQPDSDYNVLIGGGLNSYATLNEWFGTPNDCLISEASARGPGFPTILLDDIDHGIVSPLGCQSPDYFVMGAAAEALIADSIFEGGRAFANSAQASLPQQSGSSSNNPLSKAIMLIYDDLLTGETDSFTVSVVESEPTSFAIFWLGVESVIPRLRLTIESPSGTVYSGSGPGIQHDLSPEPGFGHIMFETFAVAATEPGEWILRVRGVDVPAQGHSYAIITSVNNSPFTFNSKLDQITYDIGENGLLTAVLAENGIPLLGSETTTTITFPDGRQITLPLRDDGQNGDMVANDGNYSLSWQAEECGLHIFNVESRAVTSAGIVVRDYSLHTVVNMPGEFACIGNFNYLPAVLKE